MNGCEPMSPVDPNATLAGVCLGDLQLKAKNLEEPKTRNTQ